ncbi:MAG: undecaprenyldiphospho-muramoylpentapeptide beta-N-acetylglucosaminyltransferase [Bacteroidales bacterium]|nr:undecaprenyldiphospho-muramoylpentapeptide beta-N-acetylglucosaminyltransferase [Bacteroidales bacterium]
MEQRETKIMISGGGTGGHVFPAIAIARALEAKLDNIRFLFVGAKGRMEMEKVPAAGYNIEALNISGFHRKLTLKNLSFPFKLLFSMIKARKLVKKFNPDIVIGVGGYASGPVLRVAARLDIPTLIQEQNSFPGITNRILAKSVDRICVAYNNMEKFFPKEKIYLTGNPVRQEIVAMKADKKEALETFNLNPDKKTILIVGGSLGARSINLGVIKALDELINHDIQLIWQTGKHYFEEGKKAVNNLNTDNVYVTDFISRMDLAYSAVDLVVSRAGAIAISEIQGVKKPAILVPSPNVAEDHQTKNAMALVNYHAAVLVKDRNAASELGETILKLIKHDKELLKLNENISKLAKTNAADSIAGVILDMIEFK